MTDTLSITSYGYFLRVISGDVGMDGANLLKREVSMTRDEVIACLIYPGFATPEQIQCRDNAFHRLILEFDNPDEIASLLHAEFIRYDIGSLEGAQYNGPNPKHAHDILKFFLSDAILARINHDAVFNWFRKTKFEHHRQPDASNIGTTTHNFSRWSNGELKDLKSLSSFMKNKQLLNFVAATVLRKNDAEGFAHLMSIAKFRDYAIANLPSLLKIYSPLSDEFYGFLSIPADNKFTISSYIGHLAEYANSGLTEKMQETYASEYSPKIGHEILYSIRNSDSKAAEILASKVIQDGGDWFQAYKQITLGHYAHLDFPLPSRNTDAELIEILDSFTVRSSTMQKSCIKGIIKGVQKEVALAAAKLSPTNAEKLFAIREEDIFLPLVSPQTRRKSLGNDLGL